MSIVPDQAEWRADVLKTALEEIGEQRRLKLGKAQAPVRVAVTGRSVGLPLFESLELLGRERTLDRLRTAFGRRPTLLLASAVERLSHRG